MKRYAEQVSIELGYDGELNNEVLIEAQRRLNQQVEDDTNGDVLVYHPIHCDIQKEVDQLISNPFEHEHIEYRGDGRVELTCYHGCGHPSLKLQNRPPNSTDGIHGCCGCCQHPSFKELEARILQRWKKKE